MKKIIMITLLMMGLMMNGIACSKDSSADETQGDAGRVEGAETNSEKDGANIKIGLSIRGLDNPYYVQIHEGAELFCKKTFPDGNYDLQVLECGGSDDKQINDVKAFIASAGEDAILYVDPNNAPNTAVIAELCEEAGIYWNTVWSYADGIYPMDYTYYTHHQTADNEMGGYEMAKALFGSLKKPGEGKVLVMLGVLTNDASIDREKGFKRALEETPGIEVLDTQPADFNSQKALTVMQTWISKYGDDIEGVWCANDSMALAAVEALRGAELNGKVKVTGFDCIDDVLKGIDDGDVFGTYASNPYMQAGYGLAYNYNAYKGEIKTDDMAPEKRMIQTKGVTVTAENVGDYRKDFVDSKPDYDYNDLDYCISRSFDLDHLK